MTDYQIVCTNQDPSWACHEHARIVSVGTGDSSGWNRRWSLQEVVNAMDYGHRFYTVSPSTRQTAFVHKYTCGHCRRTYIRSAPDAVRDNNLDSLATCAGRAVGA